MCLVVFSLYSVYVCRRVATKVNLLVWQPSWGYLIPLWLSELAGPPRLAPLTGGRAFFSLSVLHLLCLYLPFPAKHPISLSHIYTLSISQPFPVCAHPSPCAFPCPSGDALTFNKSNGHPSHSLLITQLFFFFLIFSATNTLASVLLLLTGVSFHLLSPTAKPWLSSWCYNYTLFITVTSQQTNHPSRY